MSLVLFDGQLFKLLSHNYYVIKTGFLKDRLSRIFCNLNIFDTLRFFSCIICILLHEIVYTTVFQIKLFIADEARINNNHNNN